ncbi:MAG: hypothetical protein KDA86_01525 [Planctomycetaceae bacterium]|nr:hypothetical protein [Planctomycetaceae bacterium]
MRNSPHIRFQHNSAPDDLLLNGENGSAPSLRIAIVMVLIMAPVGAVAARLVRLQGQLSKEFVDDWEVTSFTEAPIPCRDGRILSVDGQVLAHDRLRYDLLVHYRWLEDPPDERWLTQQALSKLSRRARRDQQQVQAAKTRVLRQRDLMWASLASTLNMQQSQLISVRKDIQQRVEQIVESVTRRRDERMADSAPPPPPTLEFDSSETTPLDARWWSQLWEMAVGQLTTPPRRGRLDPVIVSEELDHHVVAIDIDLAAVTTIETASSRFPGVVISPTSERVYPQSQIAGHVVGVRTEVRPDEVSSDTNQTGSQGSTILQVGDRIGRDGIERSYDVVLRGKRGTRRIVRDRGGEIVSQSTTVDPVPGEDVTLTLDLGLQRTAEQLLDNIIAPPASEDVNTTARPEGGCLVVLDVRTGDILTAAAAPRHDLHLLTRPDPDEWQAAISDPRRPFFPRVTQMTVPPGSVFKLLTAVALLESGQIDPDEPVFCQGYLDRPDRNRCYIYRHYGVGHGDVTLSDAICQSCNVYFFQAARSLGPAVISDWATRFGLGVPTGIEVPGEKGGHLPRAGRDGKIVGEQWYSGSTLQFGIGQASLTVTPLQVARMVAAIANGGYLVTPSIVSTDQATRITPPGSSTQQIQLVSHHVDEISDRLPERIHGVSTETLDRVREGMELVVTSKKGTGRKAAIEGIPIAGKTGTAEVGGGKGDHAWFVGFVPADAPRYAFAVVLEHGGSGGRDAAPLAKAYIEAMADAGLLYRRALEDSPTD